MTRITDVNVLFSGQEPKFTAELSQIELMKTLSWYSQNRDNKDAQKWASDYFKKNFKITNVTEHLKSRSSTFGFLCRILNNGGLLSDKDSIWFNAEVEKIQQELKTKKPVKVVDSPTVKIVVPNIQDRIKERASECIGELEGQIDELVSTKFSADVSPYAMMHGMEIKGVHTRHISEWFKKKRIEFDDALHTDDAEVKEGWSNFTKPQLKKLIAYCDQVLVDCNKLAGEAVKSRKPRKRKTKTPDQLVSKLKYLAEFPDLKLTSIAPKDIIGASQLWVFNTKNRKLGCYQAIDADGFSVKGSTLLNFNEVKSIQKTLRKPEATLPEIVKGGKVYLRSALDNIRAVESGLTGRFNSDTILIRVVK
jgi:hypothetical protein